MATAVIMPKQGQSVESCILTELRKKRGDSVAVGDTLFAYETDKASFEEQSRVAGTVLEIFYGEGDEIAVLTNVMVIGEPGEDISAFKPEGTAVSSAAPAASPASQAAPAASPQPEKRDVGANAVASPVTAHVAAGGSSDGALSPRARALARKHGVDISVLSGSGPDGRVISRDVVAAIERSPGVTPLARARMAEAEKALTHPAVGSGLAGMVRGADLVAGGAACSQPENIEGSTLVPLTNMRKLIAKAMHASLQNSAQLTHHLGADARRILALRARAKSDPATAGITLNDMVCMAVVRALLKFPQVNAHFLGEHTRRFEGVHLGLAVDTERGLMVPAVRNAEKLDMAQLSKALRDTAEAARGGAVNPDLLNPAAATFTVSNLGAYGVEMFTPIINLPQVAILGVNAIVHRPVPGADGAFEFVPYMGLSLTYDHRALDGGEATRFLKQIATELENMEF